MSTLGLAHRRAESLRVAIVHHWIVERTGGERVIESLLRLYPHADVYTNIYRPDRIDGPLRERPVRTTFVSALPYHPKLLPLYVPLMPAGLSQLDLSGYDLVISNESGPSKGVTVNTRSVHVCYCQSPMRYIWDKEDEYVAAANPLLRPAMRLAARYLRSWDRRTSAVPDVVLANSRHIQARIQAVWQRDSIIMHPPVEVDRFQPSTTRGDHYVFLGRLVPYKRADLAIAAANQLQRRLAIIGEGPDMARLKKLAGPTIEFVGRASDETVARELGTARALLFPGEEDFGIVPVEAMAAGIPVLAYARGGALDTVADGISGLLHHEQTPEALCELMMRLEAAPDAMPAAQIRQHAEMFSVENWAARFSAVVDAALDAKANVRR